MVFVRYCFIALIITFSSFQLHADSSFNDIRAQADALAPDVIKVSDLLKVSKAIRFLEESGQHVSQVDIYVGNAFKRIIGISNKVGSQRFFIKPLYTVDSRITGFALYVGNFEKTFHRFEVFKSDSTADLMEKAQGLYHDISQLNEQALAQHKNNNEYRNLDTDMVGDIMDHNRSLDGVIRDLLGKITGPVLRQRLRGREIRRESVSKIIKSMGGSAVKLSSQGILAALGTSVVAIIGYNFVNEFINSGISAVLEQALTLAELSPYVFTLYVGMVSLKANLSENLEAINIRASAAELIKRLKAKINRSWPFNKPADSCGELLSPDPLANQK